MEILTSNLPCGGYGYQFASVNVKPMTFLEITKYMENVPKDPLERYLFDIDTLLQDDERIMDCYIMDLDFLIFYKKLITVSSDMSYTVTVNCPTCGSKIKKKISLNTDIHFKQIDPEIMAGAVIDLNGHKYEISVPTVRTFLNVFQTYMRFKKIDDIQMIKIVALIGGEDFKLRGNQIENDILNATHSDITLLLALKELYYDRILEPLTVTCPKCSKDDNVENSGEMTMGVESLIVDFFRELRINSPIDESKILFKQIVKSR